MDEALFLIENEIHIIHKTKKGGTKFGMNVSRFIPNDGTTLMVRKILVKYFRLFSIDPT
jgi:hypothetical protein